MEKKLVLSQSDKKIAGVCGGVSKYFGIDSNIIRIIWLILVLCAGVGLLAYLICWLVLPKGE